MRFNPKYFRAKTELKGHKPNNYKKYQNTRSITNQQGQNQNKFQVVNILQNKIRTYQKVKKFEKKELIKKYRARKRERRK